MTPEGKSEWADVDKYHPPKGRDIMAVYTFYSGEVVQQKYLATAEESFCGLDKPMMVLHWDAELPKLNDSTFIYLDSGIIRQTKDIEKIVWSYC